MATKPKVVDDRATFTMSLAELRVLQKILGARSVYRLATDDGLSEREIKLFEGLYRALSDFFVEIA